MFHLGGPDQNKSEQNSHCDCGSGLFMIRLTTQVQQMKRGHTCMNPTESEDPCLTFAEQPVSK